MKIKICGLTNPEDVKAAVEAGASYLGFIFYPKSPRCVTPEQAAALTRGVNIPKVGVFVDMPPREVIAIMEQCGLDIAQLHGSESAADIEAIGAHRVWKAVRLNSPADIEAAAALPAAAILADAVTGNGGLGKCCDWTLAAKAAARMKLILAGGLNPGNLRDAMEQVKPFALDLCSGVESEPGKKDHQKLKEIKNYA
jgi:phosphoribosylanthranilate isomerase